MRFALIGDHADGWSMSRALVSSGRYELAVYCGSSPQLLRSEFPAVRASGDLEDVLADPAVEAVIIAGPVALRAEQLRRVLQSERHALCVHPVSLTTDAGYEAAMLQGDTGRVLMPLCPDALHPALEQLRTLVAEEEAAAFLRLECATDGRLAREWAETGRIAGLWGWDVLRRVRGDIAEVSAYAEEETINPQKPLLIAGRFQAGGLFEVMHLPGASKSAISIHVQSRLGQAELLLPSGSDASARLHSWHGHQTWDPLDPWAALVAAFDSAIDRWRQGPILAPAGTPTPVAPTDPRPTWQDEIRSVELDDAVRRSVEKRHSSVLEYQEATEEATFKGTMTLVGCGLLWLLVFLLILSRWAPWLGWLGIFSIGVFLLLQLLRGLAQSSGTKKTQK
jgi:hypothetical protein